MGIECTTFISSSIHAAFFHEHNFAIIAKILYDQMPNDQNSENDKKCTLNSLGSYLPTPHPSPPSLTLSPPPSPYLSAPPSPFHPLPLSSSLSLPSLSPFLSPPLSSSLTPFLSPPQGARNRRVI